MKWALKTNSVEKFFVLKPNKMTVVTLVSTPDPRSIIPIYKDCMTVSNEREHDDLVNKGKRKSLKIMIKKIISLDLEMVCQNLSKTMIRH